MSVRKTVKEIHTPVGMARAHLWRPTRPFGALVLGHGAGGLPWPAALLAPTTPPSQRWQVAPVHQPPRVSGRPATTTAALMLGASLARRDPPPAGASHPDAPDGLDPDAEGGGAT